MMTGLAATWGRLSAQKKVFAVIAAGATALALTMLARSAATPRMALLYAGLDPAAAGEVLNALEGMDVAAEARGDAIYVAETRRDGVRMALAREGLPAQGQSGFELLDGLNGFATTTEMFDATYWRAKEGELARTILSSPGLKAARVHLAVPKPSSFSRATVAPSAVVTVSTARGALDQRQALAIRYLVALAVPRLAPDQVAVIDAAFGVILKPGAATADIALAEGAEARAREMEQSLVGLLEARVGAGNARVAVSLDLDHEAETVTERLIDPDTRVIVNRESGDVAETDVGSGGGAVTVASNLPEGDAGAATSQSRSERSESSETTRFDISETRRERKKEPGAVKRATIAVLINDAPATDAEGEPARAARTPEELESLRKLIAAAAGFDERRGDVVTIESLAFEPISVAGAEIEKATLSDFLALHFMPILQLVVPAIVALILALFVVKPLLAPKNGDVPAAAPALLAASLPEPARIEPARASPVDEMRRVAAEKKAASATVITSWLGEAEVAS